MRNGLLIQLLSFESINQSRGQDFVRARRMHVVRAVCPCIVWEVMAGAKDSIYALCVYSVYTRARWDHSYSAKQSFVSINARLYLALFLSDVRGMRSGNEEYSYLSQKRQNDLDCILLRALCPSHFARAQHPSWLCNTCVCVCDSKSDEKLLEN